MQGRSAVLVSSVDVSSKLPDQALHHIQDSFVDCHDTVNGENP
jgi:hypothetical protein